MRQVNEYLFIKWGHSNSSNRRYDAKIPREGVIIWGVQQGIENEVVHLGLPDLTADSLDVGASGQ